MTPCLFCKIINKEIPSKTIHEDESCIAFHDIAPQAPTHLLIVPRRHIEKTADISPQDKELVGHLHWVASVIARKLKITDFRLVMNNGTEAGQSVWHLHLHLLGGRPFSWPPG
ncbi:MAG: histidine triad nucleotide-binding protein [Deltaproteobacteria bacterium]|nr:histidine triad nucleotide-binding protein [Deltaproteobacteria bacterium]